MTSEREAPSHPEPSEKVFVAKPLGSLEEMREAIKGGRESWGFFTTTSEARLMLQGRDAWQRLLAHPRLVEARVFHPDLDLHWLDDRGLLLRPLRADESADALEVVGGPGWLERTRTSRLWGEWLSGDRWYEERIPTPIEYRGIEGGPRNRYVFLRYREYLRKGQVEHIRYEAVEGGSR